MLDGSIFAYLSLYWILEEIFGLSEIDFIEEEFLFIQVAVGEKILNDEDDFIGCQGLQQICIGRLIMIDGVDVGLILLWLNQTTHISPLAL